MPKRYPLQLDQSLPPLRKESVNIYDATSEACVADMVVDDGLLKGSRYHEMHPRKRRVVLDPLAPDYKDIFIDKGTVLAPDEILHSTRPSALKIPLRLRDEFDHPNALPDSDLLRAINYYASVSKLPTQSMDETSLLALGLLVEQWAEDEISKVDPSLFMEVDESVDLSKYIPPLSEDDGPSGDTSEDSASDTEDSEVTRWSGEESDLMSIDMSDSDTASEIEDARNRSARTLSVNKPANGIHSGGESSTDSSDSSDDEGSSSSDESSDGSSTSGEPLPGDIPGDIPGGIPGDIPGESRNVHTDDPTERHTNNYHTPASPKLSQDGTNSDDIDSSSASSSDPSSSSDSSPESSLDSDPVSDSGSDDEE
ncbi:hypothetical protein JCM33374_g1912 [Metschnikowia sp. JCM 33374]|nr:hypothetical protein JCM33374_g1912 [Metschnikowia sp. JCM 33374]